MHAPVAYAQIDPADALVFILVDHRNYGTGFFVDSDGTVLTAYHVVENAHSIVLYHGKTALRDVIVDAYAPEYDLARLKVRDISEPTPYLRITSVLPPGVADEELLLFGHGTGLRNQRHVTHMTTRDYRLSGEFNAPGLRAIFAREDVQLIPLEAMSVYGGTSGGPVVSRRGVIGVFSGSLTEGGTLAWAIPLAYLAKLRAVNRRPSDIKTWPPLSLMDPGARTLRRSVQTAVAVQRHLDEFLQAVAEFRDRANEMDTAAGRALPAIILARTAVAESTAFAEDEVFDLCQQRLGEFASAADGVASARLKVNASFKALLAAMDEDQTLPSTQRNVQAMERVKDQLTDLVRKLNANLEVLRRNDERAKNLALAMARMKVPDGHEAAALMTVLKNIEEGVASCLSPEVRDATHEIARLYRSMGDLIESSTVGLDTREDPWTYSDGAGFELRLSPGWEFLPRPVTHDMSREMSGLGITFRAGFGKRAGPHEGAHAVILTGTTREPGGITSDVISRERAGLATYSDVSMNRRIVAGQPALESYVTFKSGETWFRRYHILLPYPTPPKTLWISCDVPLDHVDRLESDCGSLIRSVKLTPVN